jgi:hypothetical protein
MDVEQIEVWDEPPADVNTTDPRHRYTEVVNELMKNQGKWARLAPRETPQAAKTLALNIRKGRLASFAPEGAFEANYRDAMVWVRFIGIPDGVQMKKKYVKPEPGVTRAVRTWARANGRSVPARGNLPSDLIEEWRKATRGESE